MAVTHVAVITPFVGEAAEVVERCVASVSAQATALRVHHVFVADGTPLPPLPAASGVVEGVLGIALPTRCGDGGATPRAVGAAYALGALRVDGLAFLDVDNTFRPDHLATVAGLAEGRDVVSARRFLCHLATGEPMVEDRADSDGDRFTDPSCLFLAHGGLRLARLWGELDAQRRYVHNTMQDRHFWGLVRNATPPARRAIAPHATVDYRTPWLDHYPVKGAFPPPDRAKVVLGLPDGTRRSTWVEVLEADGDKGWRIRVTG